jgi:hypothetical protein
MVHFLKYGVQGVVVTEHVIATDVSTIEVPVEATMLQNLLM